MASNSALIVCKAAAGLLTGSVAILSDAVQSTADLIASLIALVSVAKADQPPDASHPYGHEKFENASAAAEALLILLGAAVIVYEASRRLAAPAPLDTPSIGIAVVAGAGVLNMVVSTYLTRVARSTESAALAGDAAHLRTDALVSGGVLVGLILTTVTGARWVDPVVALIVASAISFTGVRLLVGAFRVLVDESVPPDDLVAIREAAREFTSQGVVGYHDLRARHAGGRHLVDLHVQFSAGTSLEAAHATAHALQDAIKRRLPNSEVLIHLEPEAAVRPDGKPMPTATD
ncbi:MAG: cation diffusion facilitator family transporter [Thermoleophilaceae bacterium]